MPGMPTVWPTKVEVKISEPPPRSTIAGTWYFAPRKALVRLVSSVSRQASSDKSGNRPHRADDAGIVEGDVEAADIPRWRSSTSALA